MLPSSPTIDRSEAPYISVRIWCSECVSDLDYDGDGWYCPDCRAQWGSGDWDGDTAQYWLDDEGDEHFYKEEHR